MTIEFDKGGNVTWHFYRKVIKGLECCTARNGTCKYKQEPICPYVEHCQKEDYAALQRDALSLLKEQEAKYGYWINPTSQDCHCSKCGEQPVHEPGESVPLYDYCPYCGAKMEVKWNEQP